MGGAAARIIQIHVRHERVVTRRLAAWSGIRRHAGGARCQVYETSGHGGAFALVADCKKANGQRWTFEVAARGYI